MELMRLRAEITRLRADRIVTADVPAVGPEADEEIQLRRQMITVESRFADVPVAMLKAFEITPGLGASRILTEAQSIDLVRTLEQTAGVEILTVPRITTLHQRDAHIELTETNDFNGFEVKVGPELRVKAQVHRGLQSITLNLDAELTELVVVDKENTNRTKSIRRTGVVATPTLEDGQTAVLAQWLNNERPRNNDALAMGRCLLVLVTPTLIDPAGNRIHRSGEPPPL